MRSQILFVFLHRPRLGLCGREGKGEPTTKNKNPDRMDYDFENESTAEQLAKELRESGWNAHVTDETGWHAESKVRAGRPSGLGDERQQRALEDAVRLQGRVTADIIGDSMTDLDIEDGYEVIIDTTARPHDGDVVLACIDDEFTVKVLFTDAKGQRWLLPANKSFAPIMMEPAAQIRGCVVRVMKRKPHMDYNACLGVLKAAGSVKLRVPTDFEVQHAITVVAKRVRSGRQWYVLMRALVDTHYLQPTEYARFVKLVEVFAAECRFKPSVRELSRLAVDSFSKPIERWDKNNAPVKGTVFDEYLSLAQQALALLEKEERLELPF